MNIFCWMLVGHMVGDFLLQTGWMAKKTINMASLITHCLVYALAVYVSTLPAGGLSVTALLVIFVSHLVLDQRKFVFFWVSRVNKAESLQWMNIVIDQSFHLLVLALAAQYLNK